MTLLTITVAALLTLLAILALLALRVIKRRAELRSEHQRLNNLPAIHILTAQAIINLHADGEGINKRAANILAEMAGWRLEDVLEVLQARYSLTVDELTSPWAFAEAKVADQLEDHFSDDQIRDVVEALYTAPPEYMM